MRLTVRRLDPETDAPLFEEIQQWLRGSPQWRREAEQMNTWANPIERYAALSDPTRIDIGTFEDGNLVADICLVLRGRNTYEVYLDAQRGVALDTIIEAGLTIRDQMLNHNMELAFAWVPRQHRAAKEIIKSIGFTDDCVSMWLGGGRLIEWQRFSLRGTDGR